VDTKQEVLRGGLYLLGRYCASIALKAIGVVLITRALGPEQYGVFIIAFAVYQYALSVGQAGLHVYLLRHEGEVSERTYGTATVGLLALALLTFMGVNLVATHLDDIT
jgi:O-antigen/teichoic acid export membrane protein